MLKNEIILSFVRPYIPEQRMDFWNIDFWLNNYMDYINSWIKDLFIWGLPSLFDNWTSLILSYFIIGIFLSFLIIFIHILKNKIFKKFEFNPDNKYLILIWILPFMKIFSWILIWLNTKKSIYEKIILGFLIPYISQIIIIISIIIFNFTDMYLWLFHNNLFILSFIYIGILVYLIKKIYKHKIISFK